MQGRDRNANLRTDLWDMVGEGGKEGGDVGEWHRHAYTAMCETASGRLLCSTGGSAGCSVMTWRGGVGGRGHMYT